MSKRHSHRSFWNREPRNLQPGHRILALSCEPACFGYDLICQVISIFALGHALSQYFQLVEGQKTAPERRLLRTANLDPLPFFDRLNVSRGFVQTVARAGIQPGETTAEPTHS